MPRIVLAGALSVAAFAGVPGGGAVWAQPRELPAKVVTLSGQAESHKKGAPAWEPARLRAELQEGDGVRTGLGGRATVRTASGQALRLGSRSQIFFLGPEPGVEDGPTRVRMDGGWLWVAVVPGSPAMSQIEVRAGAALVAVRGGGAALRMNADGSVLVRVHHGTAACAGPAPQRQWERMLTGPQELLVPPSGAPGRPAGLAGDKLELTWVRWNAEQDFAGGYGGKRPDP